jgi:hypothetical protein
MGNINLNSFVFNEQITRADILKVLTQEEIFSFYIGEPITNGDKICSPLRNDNIPSFGFYYRRDKSGILMFNDLATHDSGDFIVFVCKLFRLSYREAILKIAYDFNLSNIKVNAERQKILDSPKIIEKKSIELGIKIRNWEKHDAQFWKSFGIKKATLKKYYVYPISQVFFNGDSSKVDRHAYAYVEFKDGKPSYKIYQPFNKKHKWMNNANYSVHQGYMQLPKKGEVLVITKSLKDVMSIRDVIGIPSIGLQSESVMMKDSVMDEYKSRFDKVICLFDNDKAGRKLSLEFSDRYKIPHFFMPEFEDVSDFSDLVKKLGIDMARKMFMNKINKI